MGRKRFILYLRVSTKDQSTGSQQLELENYARLRGWSYRILEDKASGTTASRPMLIKVMEMARRREVDGIAVYKCDRLFRSLKQAVLTLSELVELGVEFYSHKDGIDLTTSQGRLMANLLLAFAEFEAELIRTRVKSGLQAARANGVRLGRPSKVTPVLESEILIMSRGGLSMRQIARRLKISKSSVLRVVQKLRTPKGHDDG